MSKKMKWLTEQEIGDLIWPRRAEFFDCPEDSHWAREFRLNRGIVDFACFHPKTIDLYELKITANSHSVFQLVMYLRDMKSQVDNDYFFMNKERGSRNAPDVRGHLIARFIDHEIVEFCNQINVTLWKAKIDKLGSLEEVEMVGDTYPFHEFHCPKLEKLIQTHCAVKNV